MKRFKSILVLINVLFITFLLSCSKQSENTRSRIDLSGEWAVTLIKDSNSTKGALIRLPGTTDIAKLGHLNKNTSLMHLNREYYYNDKAFYKKEVDIPQEWEGKHIVLYMERTKLTRVWIDEKLVGTSDILESPQVFDITSFVKPGKHLLTIMVDNNLKNTPYGNVHIYSDDTQTNWNGILGDFYLEASSMTYIKDLQVFPDIYNKKIKVKLTVGNSNKDNKIKTELTVTKRRGDIKVKLAPVSLVIDCDSVIEFSYDLKGNTHYWDEYHQSFYDLSVKISSTDESWSDDKIITFGMRKFATKGKHFTINDRVTFLRGKNDACVFPNTGHAPMDEETWMKVMSTAKEYGINHYRFHSWCPPDAAFRAADKLGIYMQVELPYWGNIDSLYFKMYDEGFNLLKNYANHPSFVMFSMGNELWGDTQKAGQLMNSLKNYDDRPLYALGSNVNIGYTWPTEGADFFVGARTPSNGDNHLTHLRLTHAFADSYQAGLLNSNVPSTKINYINASSQIKLPVVSHEVGQYQIYPDFKEIKKYKGVLKPWNLEKFSNRLKKSGMFDQNSDFHKASGALSVICYRAEIEAALRTGNLAGYQLLDLQDYPGQGTALVGILDAFMESKGVVEVEDWRKYSNDVVPLLEFNKYCWTNMENFYADIHIANYSDKKFNNNIKYQIKDETGKKIKDGFLKSNIIKNQGVYNYGKINCSLSSVKKATKITISVSIDSTSYNNDYSIWVYPVNQQIEIPKDLIVSNKLNKALLIHLAKGGKALLMPETYTVSHNSLPGMFIPDFWNYGMFKQISLSNGKPVSPGTLGLLMDPKHPVFNDFPTEYHTNWQWWSIIQNSNSMILDNLKNDYKPIVQVIDDMERNHKLGMIFEFNVNKGKLLVCMSQLHRNLDKPEAYQLYKSILSYMSSGEFKPVYKITPEQLTQMVKYTVTKF
jgi:hypothetical protein